MGVLWVWGGVVILILGEEEMVFGVGRELEVKFKG